MTGKYVAVLALVAAVLLVACGGDGSAAAPASMDLCTWNDSNWDQCRWQ